ncbi:MAG: NAD-dependent malic enzyme [Candidatus Contendobacter sp.]|jgi:malate dehydrogenase (oxaloacetate-decarboxylating)|nr:NAD-dependent malic enzyme [Gammaproteobacteria bacterium]MCC8995157.1 NAD-dependent malic enzyme [Candidatus Contendobacter sp.]
MKREPISPYFDIKTDADGHQYMEVYLEGIALLRLVLSNKGTAFTEDERVALGLDGLLPPQVNTLEQQVERVYRGFLREPDPIGKYQYLRALQERAETLFYALLERHLEEMMPIIYTPTVGQAVQQFSHLYQNPRGLSFSPLNIDRATKVVRNFPWNDVRMIVATDSSAILGIGDQGYGGLAIAIGKLALYTIGGGIDPFHTMPVKLDVGTDRLELLNDEFYLGVRQRRLRGQNYLAFLDKFVSAIRDRWPRAVIQWEDLAKEVAFTVLERYRKQLPSFNDDIQGTGAVALAGLLAASRLKGEALRDQRIVILGAGAGGIGVAWAISQGLMREGLSREEARDRVCVLDSRGLLVEGRNVEAYKQDYVQPLDKIADWQIANEVPTLLETIEHTKATVLLGLSGQTGAFNHPVVQAMARNTAHPAIFPLSNPTSACEALPEDIIEWSEGRAVVASGSPFPDVVHDGRTHHVGQGNNAFIFPGLGLGVMLAECREITDGMVLAGAYALAEYTAAAHLQSGRVYPPVRELREVSIRVGVRVIEQALKEGVAGNTDLAGCDLDAYLRSRFWKPRYLPIVRGDHTAMIDHPGYPKDE